METLDFGDVRFVCSSQSHESDGTVQRTLPLICGEKFSGVTNHASLSGSQMSVFGFGE